MGSRGAARGAGAQSEAEPEAGRWDCPREVALVRGLVYSGGLRLVFSTVRSIARKATVFKINKYVSQ